MNEIYLTFDDIKEDIENTTIFIHEKGLLEDITSYLTIDVCNQINIGKIADLSNSPFKEITPLEISESELESSSTYEPATIPR